MALATLIFITHHLTEWKWFSFVVEEETWWETSAVLQIIYLSIQLKNLQL